MRILVVNTGSSTVKAKLFDMKSEEPLFACRVEGVGRPAGRLVCQGAFPEDAAAREDLSAADHGEALRLLAARLPGRQGQGREISAVGHRIVHGGDRYRRPVMLDAGVLEDLQELAGLAPLHNPPGLAGVVVARELFPGVPQALCFDTAFHATQPEEATIIPLPARYRAAGLRRYGFHGLSFEHLAQALPGIAGESARGRVVAAHLGSGVSLCAMRGLKSVATSMGFSTLDGPPMATRCGSIDPGVILHLLEREEMTREDLTDLLYLRSGLYGLSGTTGDMRTLLDDPSREARLAVDVFIYRVARETGSLVAALGGLDLIVFTGGIGENSPLVRSEVCRRLEWLGVGLDEEANRRGAGRIDSGGRVGVHVVRADEELAIARHTQRLLKTGGRKEPSGVEEQ